MGKSIDYSKIKAMASSILECIGEDEEGANPDLPAQNNDYNDGGQESLDNLSPAAEEGATGGAPTESDSEAGDEEKKKKAKMSAMASMLKSKFSQ